MSTNKKTTSLLFFYISVLTIGLSALIHPFGNVKSPVSLQPILSGAQADPSVLSTLQRSCQDCHSDRTVWPWYSYVAPVSWIIEKDVRDGRRDFNMSTWDHYSPERQQELLAAVSAMVRNKKMPQLKYTLLHGSARLNAEDIDLIYKWAHSERKRIKNQAENRDVHAQAEVIVQR